MSEENCEYIDSILRRNGRDQQQRYNDKLKPDNLKLHDLDIEDWILFAYNFAKHVNYFDVSNNDNPLGDWQDLFRYFDFNDATIPLRGSVDYQKLKQEITDTLKKQESESEVTPHFTLFICFIKLLSFSQKRFNGLTKRHLDFYYQEILKVEKLPAKADKVHILFEIAKKSLAEKIAKGTELDAGKDTLGNKRVYKTEEELIANKTQVALLKNIYNHQEVVENNDGDILFKRELKTSDVANSFDGQGGDFPEGSADWWPFGYPSSADTYPELPDAKTGFSLASPLLELKEGARTVTITLKYTTPIEVGPNPGTEEDKFKIPFPPKTFKSEDLKENIDIYCSGESGWLGPYTLSTATMSQNQLVLSFAIAKDEPSVVNYNKEIHLENYTTNLPVVRFLIDSTKKKIETEIGEETFDYTGYDIYRRLAINVLNEIKIDIDVKDINSLVLENDTGVINVDKPFYPFTTDPIKKSNFIMNYPEVFRKPWTRIDFDIIWKDTPEFAGGFQDQYANYGNSSVNDSYFKLTPAVFDKEVWKDINITPAQQLFTSKNNTTKIYRTDFTFTNSGYELYKNGPLRFSLNQSFLQELYPTKYALAISKEVQTPSPDGTEPPIPKEPYIPLAETITMNYKASASTKLEDIEEDGYQKNLISLFHEDPYGQHEEHKFLKDQLKDQLSLLNQNEKAEFLENHIVPRHCKGGSLYIGLENAKIGEQVSLLIQVLEGSENPLTISFEGKERVEWAVLSNNHWKDLQDDILKDSTDNLLTSGIIKFAIPKQATKENTRLPEGYIWIRARIHKNYDAVSKVKAILSQAVVAEFDNRSNELSHLESGLPDSTISKLVTRVPQIKSITQPYNSFDGTPLETDDAYYRRISERLRHKNRAITLWDYENLVLQKFPEIYQTKCLNHTNASSFLSPGDVTLVVIPDTINKNVFDIFQPRVSRATLNKVQKYINTLNSMQVNALVVNPTYEEVQVQLSVKFYDRFDENFYQKQLSQDITKFLSPWAFDTSRSIDFGVTLHRSVLIDYLEKLEYVDYLEDVSMTIDGVSSGNSVEPSNPASILVSAKEHNVSTAIEICPDSNKIEKEKETCQI